MSPGGPFGGKQRGGKASKSRSQLTCEALEERQMLDAGALSFDFGTATSPVAPGYTRVSPITYSSTLGFGWDNATGIVARDYSPPAKNPLTRDVHIGVNQAFFVDLPNGDYNVTPVLGNPKVYTDNVSVFLEGKRVASNLSTTPGKFIQPTFRVTITDGRLNLRLVDLGGKGPWFGIAGLTIKPVTPPAPAPEPPVADAG